MRPARLLSDRGFASQSLIVKLDVYLGELKLASKNMNYFEYFGNR